jgi:hypothetical protein
MVTLNLFTSATSDTFPICKALKLKIHECSVAASDKARNMQFCRVYLVIFTIGFPVQAFGAIMFKNAAIVGAISVMSIGSDV